MISTIRRLRIATIVVISICIGSTAVQAQEGVKVIDFRATIVNGELQVTLSSLHQTGATPRTGYHTLYFVKNGAEESKVANIEGSPDVPANTIKQLSSTTLLTPGEDIDFTATYVRSVAGNNGGASDGDDLLNLVSVPRGLLAINDADSFGQMGMAGGMRVVNFLLRPRLYWKNPDVNGVNGPGWQNAGKLKIKLLHPAGGPDIELADEFISAPQSGIKKLLFSYQAPMGAGDPYLHGDGKWHVFVQPIHLGTLENPKDPDGNIIFPDMDLPVTN